MMQPFFFKTSKFLRFKINFTLCLVFVARILIISLSVKISMTKIGHLLLKDLGALQIWIEHTPKNNNKEIPQFHQKP